LHSLIFAAAAGTPFVGFGSDPKIEAFCREHGGVFFTDLY
jgi:polysaccharide pyruvyl transferase WcaK-like protein